MGPPAEIHNCRRDSRRADYISLKSHNGNTAKYAFFFFFCPAHLFPISQKHPSAANAASSSVQLFFPKGLPSRFPLQQTAYEHVYLPNCWCCIEPHISSSFPCFPASCGGTKDAPMTLAYCLTEKWLSFWSIFMTLIVLEDQQSEGHKNCWCRLLEMTEVDIRTCIKII